MDNEINENEALEPITRKACVDCKWLKILPPPEGKYPEQKDYICERDVEVPERWNRIFGLTEAHTAKTYNSCLEERYLNKYGGVCGKEGRFWEPK